MMPVNLIKTVRLGLEGAEKFLRDPTLDLRVIHLVRDPRGVLSSRMKLSWCRSSSCTNTTLVCKDLLNELQIAKKLQTKYPAK